MIFKVLQKRFPYLFIFTVVKFRLRADCSVQSHVISVTRLCFAGFPLYMSCDGSWEKSLLLQS